MIIDENVCFTNLEDHSIMRKRQMDKKPVSFKKTSRRLIQCKFNLLLFSWYYFAMDVPL